MVNKLVPITMLMISYSFGFSQTTAIPDENFELRLIEMRLDSGEVDGKVETKNIENVTTLIMNYKKVKDLTGLEDFKSLTTLDVSGNQLTSIDVTGLTKLTDINCSTNKIKELDLTNNNKYRRIQCYSNDGLNLKLGDQPGLEQLYIQRTGRTILDFSKYPKLRNLMASNNKFTTIDLSKNLNLERIAFGYNDLIKLDLSKNLKLDFISIEKNPLIYLDIRNGANDKIKTMNVSGCSELKTILVDNHKVDYLSKWKKDEKVKFKTK